MHEFGVASGIIETVLSEAEKHKAKKVNKVVIEVGRLSMLSTEQLKFSLDLLKEGTIADKAEMEILSIPVEIKCSKGHVSKASLKEPLFNSIQRLHCPKCKGKVEIMSGRECRIKEMSIED